MLGVNRAGAVREAASCHSKPASGYACVLLPPRGEKRNESHPSRGAARKLSLMKDCSVDSAFHTAIRVLTSEAWEPPQFQEKRTRSEKAILRALGEFWGVLGEALGVQTIILRMRNPILGTASHGLSNAKTTILGGAPGAIPGIDGNPHERFAFAPAFSEHFFKNWGGLTVVTSAYANVTTHTRGFRPSIPTVKFW